MRTLDKQYQERLRLTDSIKCLVNGLLYRPQKYRILKKYYAGKDNYIK